MGYDAFISYSHAADGKFAPSLQQGLQRLAKPWHRRRALHVFRDTTGLSANPGLWTSITAAMADSSYFILLASPDAAASPWVNREIELWKKTGDPARILPVLTEGDWVWDSARNDFDWAASSAVPASLAGAFSEEPRHLDMRWAHSETDLDLRNSRFRDQVAELAAPLHGMAKDELEGEDIIVHRRARRLAVAAVVLLGLLTIFSTGAAAAAVRNANDARRNEALAVSAQQEADANATEAQNNANEADRQKTQAETNAIEADRQRTQADTNAELARTNETEAQKQKQQAEANATEAQTQEQAAQTNAAEATTQRNLALSNADQARLSATEAQQQRAQALASAAEADRQRAQAVASQELAEVAEAAAVTSAEQATTAQLAAELSAQQESIAKQQALASEAVAKANEAEAKAQRDIADQRARALNSQQLAAQALLEKDQHPDRALLLAIEAVHVGAGGPDEAGALNALLEVTQEANGIEQFLQVPAGVEGSRDFLSVDASPDGSRVAATDGHEIIVWSLSGTTVTGTVVIHPGPELVTSIKFAGRDRIVANQVTGFTLQVVKLWDAVTGAQLGRWGNLETDRLIDSDVLIAAISPDGRHLIVQVFEDIYVYGTYFPHVVLVDVSTGAEHAPRYGSTKSRMSADGRYAIFSDTDSGTHNIWDLEFDQLTALYDDFEAPPLIDATGTIAYGYAYDAFFTFDLATGDPIDVLGMPSFTLKGLAYDAVTGTLALLDVVPGSSPPEITMYLIDVPNALIFASHAVSPCTALIELSPGGRWFYTSSLTTGIDDPANFDSACWQSNGARDQTEIVDVWAGSIVATLDGRSAGQDSRCVVATSCIVGGGFFADDRFAFQEVVAVEGSRTVRRLAVYDLAAGGAQVWSDDATDVDLAWSADRTFVASGSDGRALGKIWRFDGDPSGRPLTLAGSGSVRELRFVGSRLVGVGADNTLIVWDATANRSASDVTSSTGYGPGGSAALSPDGNWTAASTDGTEVTLREMVTGVETVVATIDPSESLYIDQPVTSLFGVDTTTPLVFSPEGSTLAINVETASGREARLYDTGSRSLRGTLPYPVVGFSGDGRTALGWDVYAIGQCTGCPVDNSLHMFDVTTLAAVRTIVIETELPTEIVASATLDQTGARVAAGTRNGLVVVWDVATGAELARMNTFGASDAPIGEQSLVFSPSGDRLLFAAANSLTDAVENYHLFDTASWTLRVRADLERNDFDSFADSVRFSPDGTRIATPQGFILDGYTLRSLGPRVVPRPEVGGYRDAPSNAEVGFRDDGALVMLSRHPGGFGDDLVQITTFDLVADADLACRLAGRNLSGSEWRRYMGSAPYAATCGAFAPTP